MAIGGNRAASQVQESGRSVPVHAMDRADEEQPLVSRRPPHRLLRRLDVLRERYPRRFTRLIGSSATTLIVLMLLAGWWTGLMTAWTGLGAGRVDLNAGRVVFDGWVPSQLPHETSRTVRLRIIDGARINDQPARVIFAARRLHGGHWGMISFFVDVRSPAEGDSPLTSKLEGYMNFTIDSAFMFAGPALDKRAARSLTQAGHRMLLGRDMSEAVTGGPLNLDWSIMGAQRRGWRKRFHYYMQWAQPGNTGATRPARDRP